MAERRGQRPVPEPEPEPEPVAAAPAPPRTPWWQLAMARARAALAALHAAIARPGRIGAMRTRLALIALLAAIAGAATMIGVEEATRSDAKALTGATHGYLGVQTTDALGQPGALVTFVVPGSAAGQAGIEPEDVITRVDGQNVEGSAQLGSDIAGMRAGAHITLVIQRFGSALTIDVTLGSRPANAP
jgi:S1-C subfamily serine protease